MASLPSTHGMMRVAPLILILILLAPGLAGAQIPELEWERYFDSQRVPSEDWLTAAATDARGRIYVSGTTARPPFERSTLTASYDADGNLLWKSTFDAISDPSVLAILAGSYGDAYVALRSPVDDGHSELVIIKYHDSGNEEWVTSYPDLDLRSDHAVRLALAPDQTIIVAGTARDSSHVEFGFLFKLSAAGERLWLERLDAQFGGIVDLATRPGGGTFVAGWANSPNLGSRRSTVRRYDADGKQRWTATPVSGGVASHIQFASDGRLFAAGTHDGMFVVELDPETGTALRVSQHSDADVLVDFEVGPDGAAYLTGYDVTVSACKDECPNDFITVKLDLEGDAVWSNRYEGTFCCAVEHPTGLFLHEGFVYVTGFSNGVVLLKYDVDTGAEDWIDRMDDGGELHLLSASTGFVVARSADRPDRGRDFQVSHMSSSGDFTWATHLDGPRHSSEHASAFTVDEAGNSYISASEGMIVSFDRYGEVRWEISCSDVGISCNPVDLGIGPDRTLYVAAAADGEDNRGFLVLKYGTTGELLWRTGYDGAADGVDSPSGFVVDAEGGVIVYGDSERPNALPDVAVVRYQNDGSERWSATIAGWSGGFGRPLDVRFDEEGNVMVTGSGHAAKVEGQSGKLLWHEARETTSADAVQSSFIPSISTRDVVVPSTRDEMQDFVRVTIPTLVRYPEDGQVLRYSDTVTLTHLAHVTHAPDDASRATHNARRSSRGG